ncbi:hypothetical protein Tco_1204416 [Tanacetum coccineum]
MPPPPTYHGLDECVSMSTPIATERLDAVLQGTLTNQTTYRRMIGGLMYLTASRPDIAFATFVCARYQARPTVKHLKEVKVVNFYFSAFKLIVLKLIFFTPSQFILFMSKVLKDSRHCLEQFCTSLSEELDQLEEEMAIKSSLNNGVLLIQSFYTSSDTTCWIPY